MQVESPVTDTVALRRRQVQVDDMFHDFALYDNSIPKIATHFGRRPKFMKRIDVFPQHWAKHEALSSDRRELHSRRPWPTVYPGSLLNDLAYWHHVREGRDGVLLIEISKRADGVGVLRCTRRDGSVTWQKQAKHGGHFALHDLTHYAVETALGYRCGFFGLIAEGWEVGETTGKGARGPLPAEAVEVERIVGLFDSERGSGMLWTSKEFSQFAPRALTDADIQKVRAVRGALFQKWFAVAPGEELELTFKLAGAAAR
jgi:hypothetical protein